MINTPREDEFPNFGSAVGILLIITPLTNTYKPNSLLGKVQLSPTPVN